MANEETNDTAASHTSRSLDELLAHEPYVYQGKVYKRSRLYRGSRIRVIIAVGYGVFMLIVVGGVVAWSMGVSLTLPSFLLGVEEDAAPTVRVPERAVQIEERAAPQASREETATSTATTSDMALSTSTSDTATGTVQTAPVATSTPASATSTTASSQGAETSVTVSTSTP